MSDFSIHDVRTVDELYDYGEVNRRLKDGWKLLAVGFDTVDEESRKVYILGNVKDIDPHAIDPNSRLSQLRNE